jgi:hypothetical protein
MIAIRCVESHTQGSETSATKAKLNYPSMGFESLRRFGKREATYTELPALGCATPIGFLNLLTSYSARDLSGLVSYR